MDYQTIYFYEKEFCVRSIVSREDHLQAFRLRHEVYCESLAWVPSSPDGLEIDRFDPFATSIGLFSDEKILLGLIRLLPPDHSFMLESDFADLIDPGYIIRKEPDTVEITRLTITPSANCRGLSARYFKILLKGLYQWSVENNVRYAFMEVERRFWKVLNRLGFISTPIGPIKEVPPAYANSMASILDWENFRDYNRKHQPEFLDWISKVRLSSLAGQWQRHGNEMMSEILKIYSEHESTPSAR